MKASRRRSVVSAQPTTGMTGGKPHWIASVGHLEIQTAPPFFTQIPYDTVLLLDSIGRDDRA